MQKKHRLNWDVYFMQCAHLAATRSTCDRGPELHYDQGRHGVGCVIVKDNMVIASGYNGSAPGLPHCDDEGHILVEGHCVRTIHAEMNALLQCAITGISCKDGVLFTTASPCFDCAKMIIRAGIKAVRVADLYESRYGLSQKSEYLFAAAKIEVQRIEV